MIQRLTDYFDPRHRKGALRFGLVFAALIFIPSGFVRADLALGGAVR